DHERVGVLGLVVERDADRLVEGDRLADLTARVRRVVLLVDRGALHLQEEALAVLQQADRLLRHRGEARLGLGTLALVARDGRVALAELSGRASPLERHVASVEEAEDRLARASDRGEAGGVRHVLVAESLRLLDDRSAGERAARVGLLEAAATAAEEH